MTIPNTPPHPKISLSQASHLLSKLKLSSSTLAQQCYDRALYGEEKLNLNAFTHLVPRDEVLHQAHTSEERYRHNQPLSPLDGIPVTIKANISIKGYPFTAGSKILGYDSNDDNKTRTICQKDAFVTKRLLRDSGAILIGITTMDEFGMGSLGTNVPIHSNQTNNKNHIIPKNPLPYLHAEQNDCLQKLIHNNDNKYKFPHWSTGGSSSGAASSIAFGSSLLSIGTDTGGSVRLPSAWNGIVGFKPTYGWMSRLGLIEYASSLDTIGILTNTVTDAHLAMHTLLPSTNEKVPNSGISFQHMVGDATAFKYNPSYLSPPIQSSEKEMNLKGIRVGIPSSFSLLEMPSYIKQAWENSVSYLFEQHNATIINLNDEDLSKEYIKQSLASYYVLACAEASSNLARYDGVRYGLDLDHSIALKRNLADSNIENDGLTTLEKQYSIHRSTYFGEEVISRILCGNAVLSSDRYHTFYENAAKVRAILSRQFQTLFRDKVDVIIVPTSISPPWNLDEDSSYKMNSTQTYANDVMTVPMSLACLPSISVPIRGCGEDETNVMGMQIVGPRMGEEHVLQTAKCLENIRFENN